MLTIHFVLVKLICCSINLEKFIPSDIPVSAGVFDQSVYRIDVDFVSGLVYQVEYNGPSKIIWVKTLNGRNHFTLLTTVARNGFPFDEGDITVAPLRGYVRVEKRLSPVWLFNLV